MTQTGQVIAGTNYTVQAGDNLTSIAQRAYGNGADWSKIYEANKQVIGPNPNALRVGEVLAIPTLSPTAGAIYIVQPGDSLTSIAQSAYHDGNQWPLIYNVNRQVIGSNPNLIQPGEVLHWSRSKHYGRHEARLFGREENYGRHEAWHFARYEVRHLARH